MSSSTSLAQKEWLAILPDQEDALPRRLLARPKHLEGINRLSESGVLTTGGILLSEPFQVDKQPGFLGSIMLVGAETKDEVLHLIKSDPYVENNVWGLEKMEIFPFRTALRAPLPYTTGSLKEFFVVVPDHPGADRAAVRPKHLARAKATGLFKFGGAYLDHHPETAEEATDSSLSFRGSAMICVGEGEEEIRQKLADDPYVLEKVWDLTKARIWHFKTAVSAPL